jgi:hypothetical protein
MITANLITVHSLATQYKLETSFYTVNDLGLIKIKHIEEIAYIEQNDISEVEKIIRMYQDLDVNFEGIDVVF